MSKKPAYRDGLPDRPAHMLALPLDRRGYPIPKFVAYHPTTGEPDFRVVDAEFMARARFHKLCFLCGQPLGRHQFFVVGPMCIANRISAEPPTHGACARYALEVCPFLTRPEAIRREANPMPGKKLPPGIMERGNPGVSVLWESRTWKRYDHRAVPGTVSSTLIDIGEPVTVEWFTKGRRATPDEAREGYEASVAKLRHAAEQEGPDAVKHFEGLDAAARRFLPQ